MPSSRLRRIMDVLGHLATHGPQTATEVSTELKLPVSSTHDMLKAMLAAGIATWTQRGYDVGPVAARLAFKITSRLDVATEAGPDLERLLREVGFDVYLAVRTGNDVIYASRFRGRQGINIDIPLGIPLFRHATAAGKLFAAYNAEVRQEVLNEELVKLTPQTRTDKSSLLRELNAIRTRGISVSKEEAVEGIIGLAAPILLEGEIVGAAHISALQGQLNNKRVALVQERLMVAVKRIELRLQGETPLPEDDMAPLESGRTPLTGSIPGRSGRANVPIL